MKKRICLTAVLLCLFILSGCSGLADDQMVTEGADSVQHILFVTDSIDDSFAEMAWTLLQQQATADDIQVTLLEVNGQSDRIGVSLNQASDGLYDVIVLDRLAQIESESWVSANASYYPDVHYLCLDTLLGEENLYSNVTYIEWDDTAVYYLYGILAAKNSAGVVAFLGEQEDIRTDNKLIAFYDGARSQNEKIVVLPYYLGEKATSEAVEQAATEAVLQQTDVFCVEDCDSVPALTQTLVELGNGAVLLVGNTAQSEESLSDNSRVLVSFAFCENNVLTNVFQQCCIGSPVAGIEQCSLQNENIILTKNMDYPGANLSPEERLNCNRLERWAMRGSVFPILAYTLSQEELNTLKMEIADGK